MAGPVPGCTAAAEAILLRVYEEGQAAYGPLDLPFAVFFRQVLDEVLKPRAFEANRTPEDIADRLGKSGGADLFLAIACEKEIPGAWEVFRRKYVPKLESLARRNGARGSDAEHVAEGLVGDLFTSPASGASRTHLGRYSGSGSLLAWLKAILHHRMTDERRTRGSHRRATKVREEHDRSRRAARSTNPSEEFDPVNLTVDAETCRRFGEVLVLGIKGLTEREREAVGLRFFEGLPPRDVARRMKIGEPRVSRLLGSGVARLQESVAAAFPGERWEDLDRLWMALRLKTVHALDGKSAAGDPGDDAPG
jgi:RNA polymerase sigma factor (sigma-70 family)